MLARATRQHGLLCLEDLLAEGVPERRVRRWLEAGRLELVHRGVYRVGGHPATPDGRVLAAILLNGAGTWASHRTACGVWGLPSVPLGGLVELVRPDGTSPARGAARVHRSRTLLPHHVTVHRGIPVTTLSRSLFDLAAIAGPRQLDRAVEEGLRTSHCSLGSLHRVLQDLAQRGRPGIRRMREQLERRGEGYVPTESELDDLGRAVLAPIAGIEWQVPLTDESGYIRRVDGLHVPSGLVIEWDGVAFHGLSRDRAADAAGDERLRALGLEVVRFGWDDVTRQPERVLAEVREHVTARGSGA